MAIWLHAKTGAKDSQADAVSMVRAAFSLIPEGTCTKSLDRSRRGLLNDQSLVRTASKVHRMYVFNPVWAVNLKSRYLLSISRHQSLEVFGGYPIILY